MDTLHTLLHRARRTYLDFLRWLVLGSAVGVVVAFAGAGFHHLTEYARAIRLANGWLLFLLPLTGLLIVAQYQFAGMYGDRGTNAVLLAVRENEAIPLRIFPLISVSTALTHLTGGSSGREGAALQLGSSIASFLGRKLRLPDKEARVLAMCGMAAGFSAVFGTPLASAVFALEVVSVGAMHYAALAPCMAAALVAGLLTGLDTGIFHTFMGIPAILAGILTQLSLYSINLKIMGKSNQAINVDKLDLLVSLRWVKEAALRNPLAMVTVITVALIALLYWFFGTELGCGIRATGSNPNMGRAQGINTDFNVVLGLMLSNGLVAFSGALLAQYQGFADVSMGRGAIVIGLAACIIGEAVFGRIFHNFALRLLAVAFGSIIYYIVVQVALAFIPDANMLKLLSALVVAIFLAVPYWKGKYFSKGGKK